MAQHSIQDLSWYRALTLAERAALPGDGEHVGLNGSIDRDLARDRLERWRSQSSFATGGHFNQRLAGDGLAEDEFFHLLGESAESLCSRISSAPHWLAELTRAFSPSATPSADETPASASEMADGRLAIAGFLELVGPLLRRGAERLAEGIRELQQTSSALPFEPDKVKALLGAHLSEQLLVVVSRTLVLELNVGRLRGELAGNTGEERFQSFIERLRHRDVALAILQEYPVLARHVVNCIDKWVAFNREFLRHLCADWESIQATFDLDNEGNEPGPLVALERAGDTHRDGRSVTIVQFRSGFKLVYKPRSLAVDVHFQELLDWLNERGDHPPFRTLKVLDRQTHGWVEFVRADECLSPEEVERFYRRQGGYLALLYALEATDFHYENLIAAGEHPVLVDLESLFHPRIDAGKINRAAGLAGRTMGHSVLRIGLLPQRLWATEESEGVDLSGLGAQAGQLTPRAAPNWEGPGTDHMRFTRKRVEMPGADNRPNLQGEDVDVLDYAAAIERGFATIYNLLLQHRDQLLAGSGPLARFAKDEVRVILRPTHAYAMLLYEGYHPDVLRDGLDRERHFDWLWQGVEHNPLLAQIVADERDDLLNGDIPMFTTYPSSTAIASSRGSWHPDFFEQSGLAQVQERIERLGATDLERQLWFVHASLATLTLSAEPAAASEASEWSTPAPLGSKTEANLGRAQLLTHARAIGSQLEMLALREENEVAWIGVTLVGERSWMLLPLGFDLYSGVPGVALFLAYLGEITADLRYTELARISLATIQNQLKEIEDSLKDIGGFGGWGSIVYTFTHLAALWQEPALLAEAEAMVRRLPQIIPEDESLDVLGGAAGCIAGLLSLYHCRPAASTLATAVQCGDHLVSRSQTMVEGIGWPTTMASDRPLAGFSHGTAGIVWALQELAAASGEERFHRAALDGLAYERTLFSPTEGNWPDLRDLEGASPTVEHDGERFMSTWCHGAPGIGMARLGMLRHFDDGHLRAEIDVALQNTLAKGFGLSHSLCHGDLGNLELLLQASDVLGEPEWRHKANAIAAGTLKSIETHGWQCGVPQGVETPGLLTGLAGIGYELLRLADPQHVPAVLLLEPPRQV